MIAEEYGRALFSLTEDMGISDRVLSDLKDCVEAISLSPEYVTLTDSPAISTEEKLSLVGEAFGSVEEPLRNLLLILASARRFGLLSSILKKYEELYNESRGIISAQIISAVELSEEKVDKIIKKLEAITGKKIQARCVVDNSLIGGIKLRYGGIQLDGSLKSRLEEIEKRLAATVI